MHLLTNPVMLGIYIVSRSIEGIEPSAQRGAHHHPKFLKLMVIVLLITIVLLLFISSPRVIHLVVISLLFIIVVVWFFFITTVTVLFITTVPWSSRIQGQTNLSRGSGRLKLGSTRSPRPCLHSPPRSSAQ